MRRMTEHECEECESVMLEKLSQHEKVCSDCGLVQTVYWLTLTASEFGVANQYNLPRKRKTCPARAKSSGARKAYVKKGIIS